METAWKQTFDHPINQEDLIEMEQEYALFRLAGFDHYFAASLSAERPVT